jgi:hypothetical protein
MGNYTTTALNAVMKELWPTKDFADLTHSAKSRPLFTALKKDETVGGKYTQIPALVEDGQGISPTFATAQGNTGAAELRTFSVTTVALHGVARVDSEAIALTKNDRASLVRAVDLAMRSGVNAMANEIETHLFRTAGGSIGTVVETTGTTITMGTSLRDINNFALNMKVVFAANETSALRDSGASVTVSTINRDAGTMVVTPDLSGISGLTTLDSMFREGTYVNASDVKAISGLASWCPASAPSATAFFGVNRSVDTRLGGFRYTGTGMQMSEAFQNAASELAENGSGAPDVILCSYYDFRTLVAELGSTVQRSAGKLGQAGFSAIEIFGPKGTMEVMPCTKCPAGHAYVGELGTLKLLSAGPAIRVDAEDGQEWTKVYNQSAYECRLVFYGNLACENTAAWCHVIL